MAATFEWSGTYGTSPGTVLDFGASSGNLFNFKNYDSLVSAADYTTYPVVAGNNSFEVWLRGKWSGTFNKIENLQFFKSSGGPDSGISIKWDGSGNTTYSTPVSTASSIATADVPTADPGTANVSIGNSLSGSLTSAGYSDYIVLQVQTTVSAAAGDSSSYTFTLQYDEN